jgi:Kef-type K+ transport system membrane component KefB
VTELIALGLILLVALLAGHLVKLVRVPEVTGYLLAGVVLGPSVFDLISHESLQRLSVFSEVALGLILFSIGSVFDMTRLRISGRRVLVITLVEALLAAALVSGGALAVGQPWPVALLLGTIAMETAAASTLMVIRESNTAGPLTDTLTSIIAINNVLALVAFALVAAALDLHRGALTTGITGEVLYRSFFPLIWQLAGSVALGFLVGLLLTVWAGHVVEHGEMLILLAGCILLTVGVAGALGLSPLVASLAVGGTMVNLSAESRRLFAALGRTDPPLYAIFFVIAGADLNLALLPSLGLLGVVYVLGRAAGKVIGTRFAARRMEAEPEVQRYLGAAMLAQAGLAIGLLLSINERYPDLAPTITTVVLAGVAIFELVGPLTARLAFVRSGEVGRETDEAGDTLLSTLS